MTAKEPDPGDWEKLLDFAERLLGGHISPLIAWPLGALTVVTLVIIICAAAVMAIAKLKEAWQNNLRPKSYSPEQRQEAEARRQFAQHLQLEIVSKNQKENWRDQQFTDLEAEVEAEGKRWHLWPWRSSSTGLRRERSLSIALRHSTERLILVEGDPGTGKSVALRHVAHALAARSAKARSLSSKLPVYVNLKELKRSKSEAVDRELIRNFVISSINRVNDRFVDEFLEKNFDRGLKTGQWVFFFDSFDEIPDVLSSTESDDIVDQYSNAISDFLSGINKCRGIVASRHYRGPQRSGWKTFRILELNTKQKQDLIKKSVLGRPTLALNIQSDLAVASDDIRALSRNPMLLGLLCEHVKLGYGFPATAHEVLSKYIDYRLSNDAARVSTRFNIDSTMLRVTAENCAFVMTADAEMGLSPTLNEICTALNNNLMSINNDELEAYLSALVYMKIGRFYNMDAPSASRQFTFSHRRFQEHFATCVVLRDQNLINFDNLLKDARWRETAVTLLQTGSETAINILLGRAKALLTLTSEQDAFEAKTNPQNRLNFPWTTIQLHILRILEAGTLGNPDRIPSDMRTSIGRLLGIASTSNNLLDKKLALEVAGTSPHETLISLMQNALLTGSIWLSDVVYRQASRLPNPVPEIYRSVRISVLRISRSGNLGKEYVATKAYLSRLPLAGRLQSALRLSYFSPLIDLAIFPLNVAIIASLSAHTNGIIAAFSCILFWTSSLLIRRSNSRNVMLFIGLYLRFFAAVSVIFTWSAGIHHLNYSWYYFDKAALNEFFSLLYDFSSSAKKNHAGSGLLTLSGTLIAFTTIYCSIWYLSAETAIKEGKHLSPASWLILPFYLIAKQIHNAFTDKLYRTNLISIFIGPGLTGILLVVALEYIPAISYIVTIISLVILALSTISIIGLSIIFAKDFLFFSTWKRENQASVSAEAFSNLRPNIITPWIFSYSLKWVVDQPMSGSPGAWVSAVEQQLEKRYSGDSIYFERDLLDDSKAMMYFYRKTPLSFIFKSSFVEQRDYLYRLLERATASERSM